MAYAIPAIKPLAARSERRGPGERKRKEHQDQQVRQDYQDAITGRQAFMLAPAPMGPKTNQSGLLEAVSQRDSEQPAFLVSQCTPTLNSGSGAGLQRSNTAEQNQSPGLGSDPSYRQIAYNEYLAQAFGLSPQEGKGEITEEQANCTVVDAVPSSRSHLSASSMELSFRLSLRERRPKIQLTIPRTKSKTYAAIPHGEMKGRRQDTPKGVSPPSTTIQDQVESGGAPVRVSVVSPMSVVEMPKPRRPFSTFSLEEMTDGVPNSETLLSKSASSDSSDDTGEHDGSKFSTHSPHSSVSSLASDPAAVKPVAVNGFKRASPATSPIAVRGLTPKQIVSAMPRYPRGKRSIKSLHEEAHRNKPLPPAPGPDAVKPLNYSTHSLGRTNSMQASRMTPRPRCASRQSSVSSHKSLRSKFTPIDHDAGENTLRRSRSKTVDPPPQVLLGSPTLSQAELELEAHLCSIEEDFPLSSREVPPIHDPLQISRGPMHMEPSRNPPSPPSSQGLVESPVTSEKMRPRRSVTHVAMQMRPGKELPWIPRKRVSAPVVGSNDKAHRVLGRNCDAGIITRRETSAKPRWKPSESPHSSPNLSMDDPETPESERSPLISNATFEEVRQRLELLSPKSDALQDFLEFREQNRSSGEVTPPRHQSNARNPSSDTNSINSPSRPVELATTEQDQAALRYHQTVPLPPVHLTPALPERHTGRLEPRKQPRHDRSSNRSRSFTAAKVPAIHASLPSPRLAEEEADRMISAADAESVLLRILENLGNLQDLFAAARVSRGFYRTFKRNELRLMKNALHAMSPAAWELREISPPLFAAENTSASTVGGYTPQLYLQRYRNDMYVMVALKTMILNRCESFLGADTITALAGGETERASHIDDAFWRIWTFCRLFGCDNKKEDDIVYQMDWLRGGVLAKEQRRTARTLDSSPDLSSNDTLFNGLPAFGRGNSGGLSAEELYDMTEIWTCLGVLVSSFQGKRELAREFGVFENSDIVVGDVQREDSMLGIASLISFEAPQLMLSRRMDIPPPHSRSTRDSRCNAPYVSRFRPVRSCSLSRVYRLVASV